MTDACYFQVLLVFALLAVVTSASELQQYQEQQQEDGDEHTPYQFSYAVDDDDTVFSQSEQGDEDGDVTGEYSVNLPDGRVQTVKYFGDNEDGYTAEVSYEGEAQYPEQPSYQPEEQEEEEAEHEEEEEEEGDEEEDLIPIYAYRPVYN